MSTESLAASPDGHETKRTAADVSLELANILLEEEKIHDLVVQKVVEQKEGIDAIAAALGLPVGVSVNGIVIRAKEIRASLTCHANAIRALRPRLERAVDEVVKDIDYPAVPS